MARTLTAADLLANLDVQRLISRDAFAQLDDLAQAERIQDEIVAARVARGERPRGYKIGFTNRTIWPLYGVHHPIWGPIYDTTLRLLDGVSADLDAGRFVLPRLEPEIVFGMRAAPASAALPDLAAALDWIAHGVEVVQSPYPDWRFTAAESFAAQALHGALLVGPRRPAVELAGSPDELTGLLARFSIELHQGDALVARGRGSDVLDGALHALGHLVRQLGARGRALAPGDVITTGTLTDAQPLAPGQLWHTRLDGIGLPGLSLRVV